MKTTIRLHGFATVGCPYREGEEDTYEVTLEYEPGRLEEYKTLPSGDFADHLESLHKKGAISAEDLAPSLARHFHNLISPKSLQIEVYGFSTRTEIKVKTNIGEEE